MHDFACRAVRSFVCSRVCVCVGHCERACVSSACLPVTLLISARALIRLKAVGPACVSPQMKMGFFFFFLVSSAKEGGREIETNERRLPLSASVKFFFFFSFSSGEQLSCAR